MIFHITQVHTPESCDKDIGGSKTLYVPSAPWSGRCIETPAGELLGPVPDKKYITFNVTDIVKDWISGTHSNHGFLMTSCDESLTHPDATENHLYCLSFYKPELRLKFVSGK